MRKCRQKDLTGCNQSVVGTAPNSSLNKQPNEWAEYFDGNDDLMCSLDRIFDRASIFDIKGESYRGRACTTYAVEAGEASAPVTVNQ